ncbi:nucleotide-binding universal stress UspA family protein [Psychromicrobium silvestre]|uniref:Nucleotide-binding universal stress UspA family protein n=1 Tax=Psychromicrobium silvestre TaxID=1645614 RepID=A0A7Y9S748_9MICC|nr:universal stress protein [Psychromicrobium silvestre]NYE95854.1 nucleotide-binding universal stress UspA family protein [Psychromicrobium silvestre]
MRYVVGYSANLRGREALSLAIALARRQDAELDLVLVLPEESPFNAAYPPSSGFDATLEKQAQSWLDEALKSVPADIVARGHLRAAESEPEALNAAVEEFQAALLVVGAANQGLFKRFTVGSTVSALLHSASVPVALAPGGYQNLDPITRLSCGVGTRPGANEVLSLALDTAARRALPLRLISLLALDQDPAESSASNVQSAARAYLQDKLDGELASRSDSSALQVVIEVAQGRSIEQAVDTLDWQPGEVLLIGSSRLARAHSLFLGGTAQSILRALPVPMIVLPRGQNPSESTRG